METIEEISSTYANSFYSPRNQESKPTITTNAIPIKYKGYLIYQRQKEVFDIVIDGRCIGMYAGLNGAKNRIDTL